MMKTTNEEVQNKRSLTRGIIAIACACALALVGVYAYLTATDQVKNIFGFTDKLDIEVVEPNWNPDNAQNLLPTQSVTKDPALHNPNEVDVYVFADVVIPKKDIVTANADGTLNESAVVDLFSYELNDGWTLKDTIVGDDGAVTYRYVYNDVVPAGETSGSIFNEVAIVNYVNEQFNTEELAQQIVINGYGAQAVGFANADEAYAAQFGENEKTFTADITVNDDSITAASEYEVKQVETLSTASLSTASIDDQVVFEDVELIEDAQYAIVPAGESVDNAIAEFTADEVIMSAASSTEGVVFGKDNRTAFAVYSADDHSLNFYKRSTVPTTGEQFEGKVVTNLYRGIEATKYNNSSRPWYRQKADITSVTFVDPGISPASTAWWFNEFTSLASVKGLDRLNTAESTSMQWMFASCAVLASIDGINSINTSRVTDMSSMFQGCKALTSLDVSNFDTSNVTNISAMFSSCESLQGITGLDSFDTSNVVGMSSVFTGSISLVSLDLSAWDTSKVTTMQQMFNNCKSLITIYVGSGWNTDSVTNSKNMFVSSPLLTGGNGTKFATAYTDATYARIDGLNGQPGYFTAK